MNRNNHLKKKYFQNDRLYYIGQLSMIKNITGAIRLLPILMYMFSMNCFEIDVLKRDQIDFSCLCCCHRHDMSSGNILVDNGLPSRLPIS